MAMFPNLVVGGRPVFSCNHSSPLPLSVAQKLNCSSKGPFIKNEFLSMCYKRSEMKSSSCYSFFFFDQTLKLSRCCEVLIQAIQCTYLALSPIFDQTLTGHGHIGALESLLSFFMSISSS